MICLLVGYVLWHNMTRQDNRGANAVTIKSTGHEKCWVSVCLTAKADRSKFKPFIAFKNAKQETKTLNDYGWMNDLTTEYTKKVLGTFSFGRFLVWDSYECHLDGNVPTSLISSNIDQAIIPNGCTKFKVPNVLWNNSFKAMCVERLIIGLQKKEHKMKLNFCEQMWLI